MSSDSELDSESDGESSRESSVISRLSLSSMNTLDVSYDHRRSNSVNHRRFLQDYEERRRPPRSETDALTVAELFERSLSISPWDVATMQNIVPIMEVLNNNIHIIDDIYVPLVPFTRSRSAEDVLYDEVVDLLEEGMRQGVTMDDAFLRDEVPVIIRDMILGGYIDDEQFSLVSEDHIRRVVPYLVRGIVENLITDELLSFEEFERELEFELSLMNIEMEEGRVNGDEEVERVIEEDGVDVEDGDVWSFTYTNNAITDDISDTISDTTNDTTSIVESNFNLKTNDDDKSTKRRSVFSFTGFKKNSNSSDDLNLNEQKKKNVSEKKHKRRGICDTRNDSKWWRSWKKWFGS